jgi:hypothetical protein
MFTSIRATSLTLQAYLQRGFEDDPLTAADFGPGGPRTVTLTNPRDATLAGVQGVSLWLYQSTRDDQRLNAPPRRVAPDQIEPTPLPIQLHYLATPVVRVDPNAPDAGPAEEHLLLGKILELFYAHPRLSGTDLQDALLGSPTAISVRLEALPIEDVARVWWALQRPYQLSVSYEVTLAEIATGEQPVLRTPVEEVRPEYAIVIGEAGGS